MSKPTENGILRGLIIGVGGSVLFELAERLKVALCTGYGDTLPDRISNLGQKIHEPQFDLGTVRFTLFLALLPIITRAIGFHRDAKSLLRLHIGALGLAMFLPLATEGKLTCHSFYLFLAFFTLSSLEIPRRIPRLAFLLVAGVFVYFFSHGPSLSLNVKSPMFSDLSAQQMSRLNWFVTLTEIVTSYILAVFLTYGALILSARAVMQGTSQNEGLLPGLQSGAIIPSED